MAQALQTSLLSAEFTELKEKNLKYGERGPEIRYIQSLNRVRNILQNYYAKYRLGP